MLKFKWDVIWIFEDFVFCFLVYKWIMFLYRIYMLYGILFSYMVNFGKWIYNKSEWLYVIYSLY